MANPSRARALLMELDRLAKEYIAARDEYESTRQTFDVAKERLISVRKRAPEVLGGVDWFEWTQKHAEVKLVGLEIGDAILAVLQEKAYSAVRDVITGLQKDPPEKRPYSPSLAAFEIYDTLDAQGFEFRTATPRREIHAALLNLKGVMKSPDMTNEYQHGESAEIYRTMLDAYGFKVEEVEGADEDRNGNLFLDEDERPSVKPDDDPPF